MVATLLGAIVVCGLTGCTLTAVLSAPESADLESTAPESQPPTSGDETAPSMTPDDTSPNGTAARPYEFGALEASPGSTWDATITDTVVDGTDIVISENMYNETRDGWQYVVGTMSAVMNNNVSAATEGQMVWASSEIMPVFVGADGKVYDIWNDGKSAVVLSNDWIGQPSVIARAGVETSGRFAIQVPSDAVPGGQFGILNQFANKIIYFGEPMS